MTSSLSIDFKFLLKILNIIVSLISRDVTMTSRPDQIKLELVRRISGIIASFFFQLYCSNVIYMNNMSDRLL